MSEALTGKVALITGAARGVGRTHALALARLGANLVLVDVPEVLPSVGYGMATGQDLAQTAAEARELGAEVVVARADVRDSIGMADAVSRARDKFGRLDIVCANAGIATMAKLTDITDEMWDELVSVNLTGAFKTVRAAVPLMREAGRGGVIVFTNSTAGITGSPMMAAYCSSKHGVTGLTRALAKELASEGIRVNSLMPTSINTSMIHNEQTYAAFGVDGVDASAVSTMEAKMQTANWLPVPWVEPQDVTNAMLWLVSDGAAMVTGALIPVDAGKSVP